MIVIVPPQIVKSSSITPATVPSIKHVPSIPLENDASGATNPAASSHVNSVGSSGSIISGSGAGRTGITNVSVTAPLSQPVLNVQVIIISPPH